MSAVEPLSPTAPAERIECIDIVRGAVVLGILLVNIIDMGLPGGDSDLPVSGPNLAAWIAVDVLFEGKMRAIFSMLFGAGLVLFTRRGEARGSVEVADLYLRRSLWLLLFGMLHAYLLWEGDVLYFYGVLGLGLYVFRKLRPRALFVLGLLVLVAGVPRNIVEAVERQQLRDAAAAADRAAREGRKLTPEQTAAKKRWQEKLADLRPGPAQIQETVRKHHSGWLAAFLARAGTVVWLESQGFYLFIVWDILSMMLIGIALLESGFLSGDLRERTYVITALAGYAIGLGLNGAVAWWLVRAGFDPVVDGWVSIPHEAGRLSLALAYIATIVLVAKRGGLRFLAPVGRMALTNYLLATVLAVIIFEGYAFGLYGRLERYQLYYVVAGIWAVQLVLSPLWLRRFRFGPMEWVWRSLTYWRRQPLLQEQVN